MNSDKKSDAERYNFLIETITSNREVWLLQAYSGMYAMLDDEQENQYLPVWPEKKYAENYAKLEWTDYEAERMGIGEFLSWLDELEEDGIKIAAFPVSEDNVTPQTAIVFKKHITETLG
jgi:hypothetical protein